MSKLSSCQGGHANSLNSRDINEFFNPRPSSLSVQERYDLVNSVGEEVVSEKRLFELIGKKQ